MHNFLKTSAVAAAMMVAGLTVSQAQQANPPAPGAPPQAQQGSETDDDDGWFWHRRGGHHGGQHGGQYGDMEGHGHGEGHGRGGKGRGMMMDANADGVIGDEEAAAMADRMFGRMDEDNNDSLSEAEFTTPPGRHRGGWRAWFGGSAEEQAAVTEVRKQKFATLDADKNGNLSRTEFFADAKARLAAADTDKDGKVTPWEMRAMGRP